MLNGGSSFLAASASSKILRLCFAVKGFESRSSSSCPINSSKRGSFSPGRNSSKSRSEAGTLFLPSPGYLPTDPSGFKFNFFLARM